MDQVFYIRSGSTTFGFNGKSAGRTDGLRGYIGLPDNNGKSGELLTVGIVENGDLQKTGNMIEALIDGELTILLLSLRQVLH